MKILDVPQAGKRGVVVGQNGRYGQISRALVIPTNPRTEDQLSVRQHLATIAANWRGLTQPQRNAWIELGASRQTRPRVGQPGPMTGFQLFVKINANLELIDQSPVTSPPAEVVFPDLVPTGLVITNTAGTIALKLNALADVNDYTLLLASPPQSQGRQICNNFRYLGLVPTPAAGFSVITSLYTSKFGVPPIGKKVFVRCKQNISGWTDIPHQWDATVPSPT